MAYGEKYKMYFYWDHNSSNNYYKVSFLKDGYASTVTTLTPSSVPFVQSFKGQKDSIENVIIGCEAQISFILENKASRSTYDTDFMSSEYKDMIVKLIEDPDGTPVTKWVGIVLPENSTREYQGYKFNYQISAVDGLADLKDVFYSSTGTQNGSIITGFEDMLTIIKTCLSKVATFSELQLDFRIQLNTYSDQMTSTENAFKENEIAQDMFYEIDGGTYKFNTCYEVLNKILKPFYCFMAISDGYYWIWCNNEADTYYYEYDWSTLTQQSRTSYDRAFNIFSALHNVVLFSRGTFSKTRGYQSINHTLYNKSYDSELITNGSFDSNITGWTNGDADDSSNTFTSFAWYDYPILGGTLGAAWTGAASSGAYNFHTSSTFTLTVGAGAPQVNVTIFVELNSETRTGGASAVPLVQMRLYNGTDGYTSGNIGQSPLLTVGGFYTFSDSFTVTGLTTANNYLDIEVEVQDATTTAIQLYFDNIGVNQVTADSPRDWLYIGTNTAYTSKNKFEDILYIADKQESTSDICAIKDSGGNYTETWTRYAKIESISLIRTLQKYMINNYKLPTDYIDCEIYDDDQEIEIHRLLFDNSVTGKYHQIVGLEKDYRNAVCRIQMKEIGIGADATSGFYHQKLNTQYDQDI